MPYIDIQIAKSDLEQSLVNELAQGITDIMSEVLGKQRELVAVSVSNVPQHHWFIAGQSLEDGSFRTTAYVCGRITQGSNTVEQKSAALEAIHLLLTRLLGPLCEASYIVLEELPATDWGYSGLSQYSRKSGVQRLENGSVDINHYLERGRALKRLETRKSFTSLFEKLAVISRRLRNPVSSRRRVII